MQNERLLDLIQLQADIAHLGPHFAEVITLAVERILPILGADGAAIELVEGDELVYRAVAGSLSSYLGFRIPIQGSLAGLAILQNEPLFTNDIFNDDRVHEAARRVEGLKSMMVQPLVHDASVVGVLKVISAQANFFNERILTPISLLANSLSAAMFYATQQNQESLLFKATHDHLTGVGNRALFMDTLKNAVLNDVKHPAAVLIIDMNGLKTLNDVYGHTVGDAMIHALAERVQQVLRPTDVFARLGGDEFGVILKPLGHASCVNSLIASIQQSLETKVNINNSDFTLSASIGVASFPSEAATMKDLLNLADERMYENKRQHYAHHSKTA